MFFAPDRHLVSRQRANGAFCGVQFGQARRQGLSGDFDGDGKADVDRLSPGSNGAWYMLFAGQLSSPHGRSSGLRRIFRSRGLLMATARPMFRSFVPSSGTSVPARTALTALSSAAPFGTSYGPACYLVLHS